MIVSAKFNLKCVEEILKSNYKINESFVVTSQPFFTKTFFPSFSLSDEQMGARLFILTSNSNTKCEFEFSKNLRRTEYLFAIYRTR
jgi:hypothetical protein